MCNIHQLAEDSHALNRASSCHAGQEVRLVLDMPTSVKSEGEETGIGVSVSKKINLNLAKHTRGSTLFTGI